jgi:tetrahydromethanopterin S-methyltransferase subunit G
MTQDTIEQIGKRVEVVEYELKAVKEQMVVRQAEFDRIHTRLDTMASKSDIHEVRDDMRAIHARLNTQTVILVGGFVLTIGGGIALKLFS